MIGFRVTAPRMLARLSLGVTISLLAALAWLALWRAEGSGLSLHHALPGHSGPLLFLAGWTVMTIAMMLPTSLPVLATFHTLAASRKDRAPLIALVVAGYVGVWIAFGGAIYVAHLAASPWLARIGSRFGPPLILLAAGAFQFTPLKHRCLDKCRSPMTVVLSHWHGIDHRRHALLLGIENGAFCVGCCWALMLLMFVVNSGALWWMLALAILMAVEKNMPWGRRLSAPLGVALVGLGALLLSW